MKPKVLIITTTFTRWKNDKLPSFVNGFAKSIKEECEIHVLAPHTLGAKKYEEIDGIKIFRFVYAPTKFEKFGSGTSIINILKNEPKTLSLVPFFVIFAAFKIAKLQFRNKYDIIHVNWLVPFGPVVGFLRLFTSFRYVVTAHGSDVFPFVSKGGMPNYLISWLHKHFTLRKINGIIAVSNPLKAAIIKLIPNISQDKISIIGMGISYYSFSNQIKRNKLHKPLKIVFVGRLTEIKGVQYLISAMSILKEKNIKFELQIYGDGSLRKDLENQTNKLGLSELINFNGLVENSKLPMKLAEGDIFVGPSITTSFGETEGLGLVFLEAMAAGLVVIGSSVGGISDIVIDRHTGILVREKDPEAIVDAVELLINDDALRKNLIENGKKLAKEYDWSTIAGKYLHIYGIERL